VKILDKFVANYPVLFGVCMLMLGFANAYLAWVHRESPVRALVDALFAVFGFMLFLLVLFAKSTKR
jgi:VIT1/CCC1 family predicted Fe2+/Mn2+ transporter